MTGNLTRRTGSKVSVQVDEEQTPVDASEKQLPGESHYPRFHEPPVSQVGRSRTSMNSVGGQIGIPLEKQGKHTALLGPLWLYRWCIGTLIGIFLISVNGTSLVLPVTAEQGDWIAVVLTEIAVLLFSSLANTIVDQYIRCWSGRRLADGKGSLAILGYLNTSILRRPSFLSSLSHRSALRKRLAYVAWLQVVLECLHLLAIVAGTGVHLADSVQISHAECYVPATDGATRGSVVKPRHNYVAGASEYMISSAVGHMKVDGYESSVGVIGPEIDGFPGNYEVEGKAALFKINATCSCGTGTAKEWSVLYATAGTGEYNSDLPNVNTGAIASGAVAVATTVDIRVNGSSAVDIILNQEIYDGGLCGGSISRLMCVVDVRPTIGRATVKYTASESGTSPAIVGIGSVADSGKSLPVSPDFGMLLESWYTSMNTTVPLTRTRANWSPPVLSWMSRGGGGLALDLAEPGIEMFNIMVYRQAHYLTSTVAVEPCTVRVKGDGSMVNMNRTCIGILAVLSIVTLISGVSLYIVTSADDKIPSRIALCSRIHYDLAAIMQIASQSEHMRSKLANMCNSESADIWNALDHSVGIGESVGTLEEEVGHVTIGTAKIVRPLQFGRRYAGVMVGKKVEEEGGEVGGCEGSCTNGWLVDAWG